jgi:hypothetical protein
MAKFRKKPVVIDAVQYFKWDDIPGVCHGGPTQQTYCQSGGAAPTTFNDIPQRRVALGLQGETHPNGLLPREATETGTGPDGKSASRPDGGGLLHIGVHGGETHDRGGAECSCAAPPTTAESWHGVCGTWVNTGCEHAISCEACCCCVQHCQCKAPAPPCAETTEGAAVGPQSSRGGGGSTPAAELLRLLEAARPYVEQWCKDRGNLALCGWSGPALLDRIDYEIAKARGER